uniref:Uncharacterized protein n=1 Tax=Phaeomonas parva TaxID=124430 RepID=A0A7S1TU80_9STRA
MTLTLTNPHPFPNPNPYPNPNPKAEVLERPELELRVAVTKLLLECASQGDTEADGAVGLCGTCASQAGDLVYGCLQEDEDNVEGWFLLGCAAQLMAPPDLQTAADAFGRAQEMLDSIREACRQMGDKFPYAEQEAAIARQRALLGDDGAGDAMDEDGGDDDEAPELVPMS